LLPIITTLQDHGGGHFCLAVGALAEIPALQDTEGTPHDYCATRLVWGRVAACTAHDRNSLKADSLRLTLCAIERFSRRNKK
jgi:hypothetical protein